MSAIKNGTENKAFAIKDDSIERHEVIDEVLVEVLKAVKLITKKVLSKKYSLK